MTEGRRFTYQAVEGAHKLLFGPKLTDASTFGQMFYQQTIALESPVNLDHGLEILLQTTTKTSNISTEGILIAPLLKDAYQTPIAKITDMKPFDVQHLMSHIRDCMEITSSINNAELTVAHINASDNPQFRHPEEIASGKRQTAPTRASQTVGTVHGHVDTFEETEIGTVIHNPAELSQIAGRDKAIELRRQFAPHPTTFVAQGFWLYEIAPDLLKKYPAIFETVSSPAENPNRPDDPVLCLQLKPDLLALSSLDFAQAIQEIQTRTDALWQEMSSLALNIRKHPNQAESLLVNAALAHPFLKKEILNDFPDFYKSKQVKTYLDVLSLAGRLAKRQSTNPVDDPQIFEHNRDFWMQSNDTIGIIKWRDRKALLFFDFRSQSNSGIESAGLVKVRKPETPSELLHIEQLLFRKRFIERLRERHPDKFVLGPEGEGTINVCQKLTLTYEEAHRNRVQQEIFLAAKAQNTKWPNVPTHVEDAINPENA